MYKNIIRNIFFAMPFLLMNENKGILRLKYIVLEKGFLSYYVRLKDNISENKKSKDFQFQVKQNTLVMFRISILLCFRFCFCVS